MTALRWHRESLRLAAFDYGRMGAYFVTICTHRRALLFQRGEYLDVAAYEWTRSGELRAEIELDAFVVMPNHATGSCGSPTTWTQRGGMNAPRTKRFG